MSDGRIPEELNTDQQQTRQIFTLGMEAKNFLTSDLAQFITDSAEAKCLAAVEKLKRVNPTDTAEIMKLQSVIARYDHYITSLEELVAAGDSAYQIYLLEHQSD